MSLKVAIQMDPVEGINIETDTTFLLMLEAQNRGHVLWVYTPDRISLEEGRVTARGRPLDLRATAISKPIPATLCSSTSRRRWSSVNRRRKDWSTG